MAMKGLSRRGERLWMARATISLPVPDSPVMATRGLGRGHLLDQLEHLAACAPDWPMKSVEPSCLRRRRSALHLAQGLLLLQRAVDADLQPRGVERLLDEVVGALADGLHRGVDGAAAGEEDHRAVRQLLLAALRSSHSPSVSGIARSDRTTSGRNSPPCCSASCPSNAVSTLWPQAAEHLRQRLARRALVVHGQNSCAAQGESSRLRRRSDEAKKIVARPARLSRAGRSAGRRPPRTGSSTPSCAHRSSRAATTSGAARARRRAASATSSTARAPSARTATAHLAARLRARRRRAAATAPGRSPARRCPPAAPARPARSRACSLHAPPAALVRQHLQRALSPVSDRSTSPGAPGRGRR